MPEDAADQMGLTGCQWPAAAAAAAGGGLASQPAPVPGGTPLGHP
jgi:hypothetical protein